ncbi:MAG TPA: hypothetical protein GXZ87_04295 [Bacteroidales bacterium]|nr:hypothetical protein [Bacteroidales bacterium]
MKRILVIGTFVFGWIFGLLAAPSSDSYFDKANKHYLNAKNDSALICLDLALANQQDTVNEYRQIIDILLLRSRVLSNLTFFEPALQDAIRAYDISKKHKTANTLAISLMGIGKVHYLMYNDSLAESYMLRAKEIAEKKELNKEMMMIENSLAQLYSVSERNEECLATVAKSLEKARLLKDTVYIIKNLNLYAAYYTNLNRYTDPIVTEYQVKVKQYLDEALQLASFQNCPLLTQKIYANYVRYYRVEKDYPQALNCANKVIEMCEPTHYTMLMQMYDHLVGIYANMGDVKMTINSHQRFYELMRRQSDYTLHRSLQEMKVKYDVQGKDQEIIHTQMHR